MCLLYYYTSKMCEMDLQKQRMNMMSMMELQILYQDASLFEKSAWLGDNDEEVICCIKILLC